MQEITAGEKLNNNLASRLEPHLWTARYGDYLYTYAFKRLNDEEQSRDLVQDTFLTALQQRKAFRGDSNERTWLTAILKYKVIDIYRKKSNALISGSHTLADNEEEFFETGTNHWKEIHWPQWFGVEDKDPLYNKEFMSVLHNCMKRLPPLWMSVFQLKYLDEEGSDEICSNMKISASNFWVIIHRAKVNLRSCLQKNWL